MTKGYRLRPRYVIHTVGPVYRGGRSQEADLLHSCYRESLKLAAASTVESIAFPCISTGVYGYPKAEACCIAVDSVSQWLSENEWPKSVIFCCYEKEDAELYHRYLAKKQ